MRNRLLAVIAFGVTTSLVSCSGTQGDPSSDSIGYGGMYVGSGAAGFAARGGTVPAGATGAGGMVAGSGGLTGPGGIIPSGGTTGTGGFVLDTGEAPGVGGFIPMPARPMFARPTSVAIGAR